MVGLIISIVFIWLAFEVWRAPIVRKNQDGTWITIRKTKTLSDLFKRKK